MNLLNPRNFLDLKLNLNFDNSFFSDEWDPKGKLGLMSSSTSSLLVSGLVEVTSLLVALQLVACWSV